ncbi:DUF3093 domain-containing protein [Mycobacterium talmoniae]|uniref:DUF3093 domain-containing protein n=1 Tax=Mycobacterium talmoniae TaxID=1858794 RepID=A0A1S1NAN4_9MYCO|nr:DUF3093 domain-containing protein [Mycobacterium talmoniae]OHU99866.1 DUF3093 domain-containing protein [Mycobacterium talmoniae]
MSADPPVPPPPPAPLFHERGDSWYWVLAGPASAVTMLLIQAHSGYGYNPLMPAIFLVLVTGFVGLQVKAARIHTSVELTEDTLRQGTETIPVGEIIKIYPEADKAASGDEVLAWQSARALGELTGVPRGRVGIGLRLTGGRKAQAWARHHRQLRAALAPLVVERTEPVNDDDEESRW